MPLIEEEAPVPAAKNSPRWKVASAILAIILALSLGLLWRASHTVGAPPKPLVRLDVDLGMDLGRELSLTAGNGTDLILSPDGTRLVFAAQGSDRQTSSHSGGTRMIHAYELQPDGTVRNIRVPYSFYPGRGRRHEYRYPGQSLLHRRSTPAPQGRRPIPKDTITNNAFGDSVTEPRPE